MTITGATCWAIAVSGAGLAAWALLIRFVPSCLCSLFRYRLWRLRDSVMDDVLRGQLPDNELINEFVSFVESFIIVAGRFSILHALFLPSNRQEAERLREAQRRAIKALDEEPRRRFLAYRRDFVRLIVERLFIGSLTGWLFLAMLFPLVALTFVYRLIQRASISVTDLIISVNRAMSRLRRTDADLGWSLFAGKIVTMRDMSGRTKSLAECAA